MISTRVSIQWPPATAREPTNTMVLMSRGNKFVDLRPFKVSDITFPFEWAFFGTKVARGKNRSMYTHEFDSRNVTGELDIAPDIGTFSTLPNGDSKEEGEMLNVETGSVQSYVEIWHDLEIHVPRGFQKSCVVLDVNDGHIKGRFIRVGEFAQGILFHNSISCVRAKFVNNKWECLTSVGRDVFPFDFDGEADEQVKISQYKWVCIECNV